MYRPSDFGGGILVTRKTLRNNQTTWESELLGWGSTRLVGVGDVPEGIRMSSSRLLTQMFHRLGTADASGTTTIQSYLNGTLIPGSAVSIIAPALTGTAFLNVYLSAGDVLTHQITVVGSTPGSRLSSHAIGT